MIAEVPRATGTAITIDLHDPLLDADQLRLVAHACDVYLHGVVRDASGGVVERARVFASEPFNVDAADTSEGPGTEAGEDGAYELCGIQTGDTVLEIDQHEVDPMQGPQGALRWIECANPEAR